MIVLSLLLAALPGRLEPISQRLDCDVHHFHESAAGERRSADRDQYSNRVFLFLPTKAKNGAGEYLSIVTMDDGRSWFSPGKVDRWEGKNWPDINVSIDGGTGFFTSDKAQSGVIRLRQKSKIYDTTDVSIMEATCKQMPDTKDRNVR